MKTIGRYCKILFLFLAVTAIFTVTCSADAGDLAGSYEASADMKDFLNSELEASGISVSSNLPAKFNLDLNEDASFKISFDAEDFGETIKSVFQKEGKDIIKGMLAAQGLDDATIDALAEQGGYDSADDMLNDLTDQMVAELDASFEGGTFETVGTWEEEDGRIHFTYNVGSEQPDTAEDTQAASSSAAAEEAQAESALEEEMSAGNFMSDVSFDYADINDDGSLTIKIKYAAGGESIPGELEFVKTEKG